MARRARILSPIQIASLVAVLFVLAVGIWTRVRPPGLEGALEVLTDGDPDHAERVGASRVVLEQGMERGDRRGLILAAMAAVALDDGTALEEIARSLGPPAPARIVPAAPGAIDELALGEPVLAQLLQAMFAEEAGRLDGARQLYARAAAAAGLWNMPLAASLARSGLERLR